MRTLYGGCGNEGCLDCDPVTVVFSDPNDTHEEVWNVKQITFWGRDGVIEW